MAGAPFGKKRQRTRIDKESRKSLRTWAEGARESILLPHLEAYMHAMDAGWTHERVYWRQVCNEFHARVPWTTRDQEEPILGEFDPSQPLPRAPILPEAEEVLKRERIQVLNARIRRWFKYRIRKTRKHRLTAGLDPTKDPFAVLLAKLSNVTAPPKARQAYQQFMHESHAERIEPVVIERWEALREEDPGNLDRPKKPKAGFRAQVARDVFAALPKQEQQQIATRAKEEAESSKKAFVKALKDPPSTAPAARQKCIDNLPDFIAPVLRGIEQYTGLHSVLIVGGPIPKYGGELRTVHVSYGRNNSAAAPHFPQWDKKRFNENVLGLMTEYLATAFDQDDRKAAALPTTSDLQGAKYKIAPTGEADGLSDNQSEPSSSDESDSADDTDPDSDLDSPSDVERRARKKRKTTAKAPPATAPARLGSAPERRAIVCDEEGRTMDERRNANMARNKKLMAALDIPTLFPAPSPPPPPIPRPKPRPLHQVPAAPRRSTRNRPGSVHTQMDVDDPHTHLDDEDEPHTCVQDGAESLMRLDDETESQTRPDYRAAPGPQGGPETESSASLVTTSLITPTLLSVPPPPPLPSMPPAPPPPSTTAGPACPAKAAQWFVDAHAQMTKIDLGAHFNAVIEAWTRMEAASKYKPGPTLLPTKGRPPQVSAWINRGQRGKRNCDTAVTNPAEYELTWQAWWSSLQPTWRKLGVDGNWSTGEYGADGREWGPLYQWGVNGVLSILASLYFWGAAVHQDPAVRPPWEAAVIDVGWMLEGMAIYYEKFNRRF